MRCPECGKHELGDGTEDSDFDPCACDCDECDICGVIIGDAIFWEAAGLVYCKDCLPKDAERIGERH